MKELTLGDSLATLIDHRGKTPKKLGVDFTDSGVPVISAKLVNNGTIDFASARYVDVATWKRWMPVQLQRNDVILTSEAPLGRTAQIRTNDPVVLGQRLFALRGAEGILDSTFLRYWLDSPRGQASLVSMASGTTVVGIKQELLLKLRLAAPTFEKQKSIGHVLGSLDDKITANSLVIENALHLQSAIWETYTRGMPIIPLAEVAKPILGGTPSRKDEENWNGEYKWASVADMTASPRSHLLTTAETISEGAIHKKRFAPLPTGSVLLSARGTVGRVVSLVEPTSFNQSAYGFKAIPGFEAALRLAVMSAVDELRGKSYGSVFSTITKAQINEATIPAVFDDPDQPLHQQLNILEKLNVAVEKENITLANTRDELLPLLMSGKITVKEAGQEAAAAGAHIPSQEGEA